MKPAQTIEGTQHETRQIEIDSFVELILNHSFCSHCSGETRPQIKLRDGKITDKFGAQLH